MPFSAGFMIRILVNLLLCGILRKHLLKAKADAGFTRRPWPVLESLWGGCYFQVPAAAFLLAANHGAIYPLFLP